MRAMIPPDLRALARVLNDVDSMQVSELFTPVGPNLPVHELEMLLEEINGAPLSAKEFRQFQMAIMEERHHLRGVDLTTVAESQVGSALSLTSRLDATCTEAKVPLAHVFPQMKEAHNFFLRITSFKCSVKQAPVFYRLSGALCSLLLCALEELQRYMDEMASSTSKSGGLKLRAEGQNYLEGGGEEDTMPWLNEGAHLPAELECILADIDGGVGFHLAHLRWYLEVSQQNTYFDSGAYLGDVSVRKIWNAYVGKEKPACFADTFSPALQFFPEWSRVAIMKVVNYRECGVVSLYTLKRLLSVWGPFLLLDRNMRDVMQVGLFELEHSLEYHKKAFARRADAQEGDCLATLTDIPGEVVALVLRRQSEKQARTDGENGLATRAIRFTQETGAWVAKGLSGAEYETVYDAFCAFPELFRRPCGKCYQLGESSEGDVQWGEFSGAVTNTASGLNRACFRNNSRYVKTLLERGSALVVNSASSDPAISTQFAWTPLLCAVNNPNSDPGDVVRMLLEAGADAELCDDAQCTALYYAICNGYVDAARVLLEHLPQLCTSRSSVPLLVALGAHHFHACESDIRRLCDYIPSVDMLRVLLPYQTSLPLLRLCVEIIRGKLRGEERLRQPTDDTSIWCPDGELELRTPEEEKFLLDIIAHNSRLCQQFREDVSSAARLLYNHCYFLSCREAFNQNPVDDQASSQCVESAPAQESS
ncbi:hypothetical protein C3747_47g94 [Trypanosoma cruzi]|uniref:Uncharacterized protein n=2 Tax=Trypanosoma cruzi TaxID=5693 RepID=Q4D8C7_TRYCC|nr:hypothetical protein, conserved [Trypanosoma cruzi]EAN88783.1 hypothetical protein, conserved [Trypanosoma cruzi]PWV12938.1 hypothetical protein C3747_47g94 [Trypanosoma cruzi]|eukprot:XP_810634.1 hypothetical protein [Trypanosoma cruzi strain CL Brener]